jgi:hypothetical protein
MSEPGYPKRVYEVVEGNGDHRSNAGKTQAKKQPAELVRAQPFRGHVELLVLFRFSTHWPRSSHEFMVIDARRGKAGVATPAIRIPGKGRRLAATVLPWPAARCHLFSPVPIQYPAF